MKFPSYTFLILEDSEPDAFILQRHLKKLVETANFKVVTNQAEYEASLQDESPDIIFSDYRLPQYSGIEALMYARVHAPVVPFIFVTGALNNEELAADTILKGASAFVLKNNLSKLEAIVPGLLNGQKEESSVTSQATQTTTPTPSPPAADLPTEPDLAVQLAGADAETLAQIRALLASKKAV